MYSKQYDNKRPIFTKGRIVKRESLEYLRDFPYDLTALAYDGYSDGILFGFAVRYENGFLHIGKGAFKYQGEIVIVPGNSFPFTEFGRYLRLKIVLGESWTTEDCHVLSMEIKLEEIRKTDFESYGNEFELGRFKLAEKAALRVVYKSLEDFRTANNTLDITGMVYAGMQSSTLHPEIVKAYARALLEGAAEGADTAFAYMCLNADVVHKESILWHLADKNGQPYREYQLGELYDQLLMVLSKQTKREVRRMGGSKGSKGPSIS